MSVIVQFLPAAFLALSCGASGGEAAVTAPQTSKPEIVLDEEIVRATVERVADVVDQEYFDRKVASRVKESLLEKLRAGSYTTVESAKNLAALLTDNLHAETSDKHLSVSYITSDDGANLSSEARQQSRELRARRQNYGAEHAQILSGNVGYLNFTTFYRLEEARDAIETAMSFLRYTDALILDMRTNRGGNPGSVALLASYLFDPPEKLLFDIVPRNGESKSYFTESVPESHRHAGRLVFVLTAASTFSAGEGFAFILQDYGRAEIVGEVTAGAANPGRPYAVNEHFEVVVPNGQVRSGVTGRNWEGTGVIPDIPTSDIDALNVAHRRALRTLLEMTNDEVWAEKLRMELERLLPP